MKLEKIIALILCLITLQACYKEQFADFDYQEGDVIPMVTKFNSYTDSVEFYWDDIKIATEYEPPYIHYFNVTKDISSGTHTYKTITYMSMKPNEYRTVSSEKKVTIR